MNDSINLNEKSGKSAAGGGFLNSKKFLKSLFSVKNVYETDKLDFLKSVKKEICILGFKINKKIKCSPYEKYILNHISSIEQLLKLKWYIAAKPEIQEVIESDKPNDKLTVENLYKNLDSEAKNNLDKIIKRNSRVIKFKKDLNRDPAPQEIYTKEELEALEKITQFNKEIEVYEDYFKWKDYILPVNFFEASVFLYKHGIESLKNKNIQGAIIDAGANIGDSALVFSKEFPQNKVISFEPTKKNYEICQKTISLNNSNNIIIENMGLGDKKETCAMDYFGALGVGSYISDKGKEKIEMTTLDNYVKENNLQVGLVKVDIEGFEPNFLKGAKETLQTQAPVLLLSIYHNCHDFFKVKPMVEEIMKNSKYKYRYDFYQPVYNSTISECLLICEKI